MARNGQVGGGSALELLGALDRAISCCDTRQIEVCCHEIAGKVWDNPEKVAEELRRRARRCHDYPRRRTILRYAERLTEPGDSARRRQTGGDAPANHRRSVRTRHRRAKAV